MNPYEYKFYVLTDDDREHLSKLKLKWAPFYVFIHKDYPFNDFLIEYSSHYENHPMWKKKYSYREPIIISKSLTKMGFPDNLCKFTEFYIHRFSRLENLWGDRFYAIKLMHENDKLVLYSKLPYFHELIFYIRVVCGSEIPEDVIKYVLGFIKKIIMT
jgi:hypothetical protein